MGYLDNLFKSFRVGSTPITPIQSIDTHTLTEEIVKSMRAHESRSIVEDPLAIVQSLKFKDKPYSLSYDILKKMATKDSVIASIILTRNNQVSSFSQPARFANDGVGYEIRLRDSKKSPTKEQKRMMMALESFLENCGFNYDPGRDNFDTFIRKIVRDSLVFDQLTFEIVPDRRGVPAEIHAVDASTIRAATIEPDKDEDYVHPTTDPKGPSWVQVINGQVAAEFSSTELAFAVRNPRTDINIQPYGLSELEILINQVTAHLYAEEYNSRYFSQGGTTKGVLNLKGQNITKEQLDAFRRQWTAQLAGVTGSWKTPVVSVEGLEYVNVSQSNREMEFDMWLSYLINISCAVYQIDPTEVNFPNRGGSTGSGGGGLGDGGIEDRLKNSKDKGLRPLLRFIESTINRHIIRRFSPDYTFNFVGLDRQSESEKMAALDKQIRTYRTVNEIRKEHDLDPIKGGEIILDATYMQYLMQQQQAEQMEQQQAMGGMGMEGTDPNQDPNQQQAELNPEEAQAQQQDDQISQGLDERYSGS